MKSIVVFCGSNEGNDPLIIQMASQLGEAFAKDNIRLIYGGAKIGIMGKLAAGVLDNKGEVIGVIPDFLKLKEVFHTQLTQLIITKNMHERKLKMHDLSDAIIALPGGFGTLEELFEMVTWAQLGLHQKPIGLLNINGFYDELLAFMCTMVNKGFLKQENYDMLLVDESIEGLLTKMRNYQPQPLPKWIKKEQL
ncbi:Putative cytokinin riboside 5'-monophosphate phosphoribohydrolase [Arenibacter antarcticus]|uniref:Cytokinin riboside 5'-monophosphate phosphoribohydrolase n=1 Tax=Arenibacter antarcticus TaxID=2040469 RepID=A0ABW5VCZ1_9FLAO|nr:TIGR00730 family Rossman fold protein [Arenibacter sp. H213]MCM4169764.1 TIGR00730 family Rossman fold protein [Arenibacter sp. H213]